MVRPVVHSTKHIIQFSNFLVTAGASNPQTLINTVPSTANRVNAVDVVEGAIIKAVYVELWVKGDGASSADTQIMVALVKLPGGQNAMTSTDMLNMQAYDNKKNIFFISQGVFGGKDTGQAVPILRQWIKIPKGKQRFGNGDELILNTSSIDTGAQRCGVAIYKEYT